MVNGKSAERGTGQAYQRGIYLTSKRKTAAADSRAVGSEIWSVSSPGLSLYSTGQRDQRKNEDTGKFCGVYRQVAPYTDPTDKKTVESQAAIDQQSGSYGAGRIFSGQGSWPKSRNRLRCHLPMTDCGSRNSRRCIVSLCQPINWLFPLNKVLMD